jgi:hypothetical protein
MKTALLLLAAASAGAAGCTNNDISMSVVQMAAVNRTTSCVAMATVGAGTIGRARGLLDIAKTSTNGYIAIPIVRNNLTPLTNNVEFNSIQLMGANVKLSTAAGATLTLANGQSSFFYASAAGRIDPGGVAAMPVEVLSAPAARSLAGMIPSGGLFTIIADIRPVGMHSSDQIIGGAIDFPIDLCSGCLTDTSTCPLAKGTIATDVCPGLQQQDDPEICCTDTTGATLCGTAAPVSAM